MATPNLAELIAVLPQRGRIEWIGLRPAKRAGMQTVARVSATVAAGLAGDRYQRDGGKRQVTLIQAEHLEAVASMLGLDHVAPATVRRNLVVRGLNLLALKHRRFCAGDVVLEWTGLCHPCSRMEAALGAGGYNAMRGHGGITARVVRSGDIHTGDVVRILDFNS